MRLIAAFIAAAVLATSGILVNASDADAYTRKSQSIVVTSNRTWSGTLVDRTPARTGIIVALQKKPGQTKCRVNRIIVRRAGATYLLGPFEKWARTYDRFGGWWLRSNRRDRTIGVTIRTNGRCIVGVATK